MEYPWFAMMARLEGTVEMLATVMPDGIVREIQIISGPEPIATPSKQNLLKWRFVGCASTDGCKVKFVYAFVLEGRCGASSRCLTEFQVDLPDHVQVKFPVFD